MTSLAAGDDGKTVVVGVKMDAQSKELLTWSLVKVANPGDLVIALHVLHPNEIVDQDGKSSLLSLVKAFDSILGVYEGFCNLKQVNLKLKICRGSSIRKIIVREATLYSSSTVIVGTTSRHHTIRSSTAVAKYCAKKLPKDCSVLAVRNGKVVFQREASMPAAGRTTDLKGATDHQHDGILEAHQRSSTMMPEAGCGQDTRKSIESMIPKVEHKETVSEQKCSVCSAISASSISSKGTLNMTDEPDVTDHDDRSTALVPFKKLEAASNSISLFIKEVPDHRPGEQNDATVPIGTETLSKQTAVGQNSNNLRRDLEYLCEKYSSTCRLFKYEELQSATSNFKAENLIGKGGSSRVYRGCLSDGKELAVKIFKKLYENVYQEFVMEIEIITSLHHKNIISLFGFCHEGSNLLLVYDLLSRGSLEENLHGIKKDSVVFGWNERYKVALGVAKALEYLHNLSTQPVIHRDVKSSNILLSDDFEPKLSDFGYAIQVSTSSYITCTDVAGTFGYLAPEYFMYGKVTDKIDVYAFGVVLLELLTGRRPISSDPPKAQESLVMWAKPILNGGKVSKLLDPRMGSNYNRDQIERMVLAANLCIRRAPRARPHMSLIMKLLQGDIDVLKWARLQVNALDNIDGIDEDGLPNPDIQSHLNLALLDVEDDSLSISSSIDQHVSLEDYLRGRWSRSVSFE
ncbi:hypothetical protein RND81_03G074600 [Saponaria officinalis]|uniref:Protein kinase domain-containing protein n=1 Tax=Saponaria officinalis TaxID=3572 RepID=A0AAW1M5I2_SAPOF